jgi:signal transduction histidine kinase
MQARRPKKKGGDSPEFRILTEQLKTIQAQMLHCEKMAAIGQLAAGVAHEINNPTGFVASNLNSLLHYQKVIGALMLQFQKLLAELKQGMGDAGDSRLLCRRVATIDRIQARFKVSEYCSDALATIKESQEGMDRIKSIVNDLKGFTHPGDDDLQQVDVHALMDSTLNLIYNEIKYKARVEKDYGRLPPIRCYAGQLNQVFLNLLINASQAIDDQGIIRIKTRFREPAVIVAISDTGCGISKDNLSNIFNPFFTTKAIGRGTGLGLHLCRSIVDKHQGRITVESQLGQGTTFSIILPVDPSADIGQTSCIDLST